MSQVIVNVREELVMSMQNPLQGTTVLGHRIKRSNGISHCGLCPERRQTPGDWDPARVDTQKLEFLPKGPAQA